MPKGANKGRDHAPAQITVVRGDSVPLSVTISMLSPRGRTCRTSARRIDPPPCIDAVANARATCEGSSTCADAGYQTPAAPRSPREAGRSAGAVPLPAAADPSVRLAEVAVLAVDPAVRLAEAVAL